VGATRNPGGAPRAGLAAVAGPGRLAGEEQRAEHENRHQVPHRPHGHTPEEGRARISSPTATGGSRHSSGDPTPITKPKGQTAPWTDLSLTADCPEGKGILFHPFTLIRTFLLP